MKTLYLLRHGKSEQDENLQDEERPLASRGVNNLISLSDFIKDRNIKPELTLVSSALRARESFLVLKKKKNKFKEVNFTDSLYEKSGEELFQFIRSIDNSFNSVMMIGHNPGFEELASILLGKNIFAKFPTSAFIQLELDNDSWSAVSESNARMRLFWIP